MTQASLWASVLGAKKAILAGAAVVATFVSVTLANNHGKNLSFKEWLVAAGAYVVVHAGTWAVSNAGTLSASKVVAALVAHPSVTTALASLGVTGVPASVEPTVPSQLGTVSLNPGQDVPPPPDIVMPDPAPVPEISVFGAPSVIKSVGIAAAYADAGVPIPEALAADSPKMATLRDAQQAQMAAGGKPWPVYATPASTLKPPAVLDPAFDDVPPDITMPDPEPYVPAVPAGPSA